MAGEMQSNESFLLSYIATKIGSTTTYSEVTYPSVQSVKL